MPTAAFCGLPHSESEVYYEKSRAIGLEPWNENNANLVQIICGRELLL